MRCEKFELKAVASPKWPFVVSLYNLLFLASLLPISLCWGRFPCSTAVNTHLLLGQRYTTDLTVHSLPLSSLYELLLQGCFLPVRRHTQISDSYRSTGVKFWKASGSYYYALQTFQTRMICPSNVEHKYASAITVRYYLCIGFLERLPLHVSVTPSLQTPSLAALCTLN